MASFVSWFGVALILFASATMLVNRDWRVKLALLAVQYLAVSWLVTRHLPFAMGAVKLITGWMVVAALGMTLMGLPETPDLEPGPAGGAYGAWYSIILMGIAAVVAAGAAPRFEAAVPGLGLPLIAGSLLLIASALIHLSLTADLLRVLLGLLTLLAGFETIYAALESSILVAGLLAVTNLALGLVGCYLLNADAPQPPLTEAEEQ
jgi:hypothetical protein